MADPSVADIENTLGTIKKKVVQLKKKDYEILSQLLKTKALLQRQKREDSKLRAMESEEEIEASLIEEESLDEEMDSEELNQIVTKFKQIVPP